MPSWQENPENSGIRLSFEIKDPDGVLSDRQIVILNDRGETIASQEKYRMICTQSTGYRLRRTMISLEQAKTYRPGK